MQPSANSKDLEGITHVKDVTDVKDVIVITKRDRVQGGARIRRELVDRYLSEVGAPSTGSTPPAAPTT